MCVAIARDQVLRRKDDEKVEELEGMTENLCGKRSDCSAPVEN